MVVEKLTKHCSSELCERDDCRRFDELKATGNYTYDADRRPLIIAQVVFPLVEQAQLYAHLPAAWHFHPPLAWLVKFRLPLSV